MSIVYEFLLFWHNASELNNLVVSRLAVLLAAIRHNFCVLVKVFYALWQQITLFAIRTQFWHFDELICIQNRGLKITGGHHCGGETFQSIFSQTG